MIPSGAERSFQNRFRDIRVLKRAEGVETYSGTDISSGTGMVIKIAPARALASAVRARLEYEIAALNQLADPRFATPIHFRLHADEDLLVLARTELPGSTLEKRLQQGPLDVRQTVALATSILGMLTEAHASGVLHRDIKPSNVLVVGDQPERAVLVDFGLARHSQAAEPSEAASLGAARYLSPEQLGLIRSGVDARSDLYSVGATLYEALAGRPAFSGQTTSEVLRVHLRSRPAPLRQFVPRIPGALERMIERLLRKDPRDRYQTAEGALADFEDLAEALDRQVEEPEIIVGAKDIHRAVTEPAFIARSELTTLEALLAAAQGGDGGLVMLEAESGGGKTWLLDELGRRAAPLGVWVLRGRAIDQTAQRPHQMLEGIIGELISASRSEPSLRLRVVEQVGLLAGAACASLPELGEIFPATDGRSLGPEAHGETRSLTALTALLDALGTEEQPALVLFDDCQWADEPTVHLLEHWLAQRPDGARRYVTIVVAVRPEDVLPTHPLSELRPTQRLKLAPFGADDIRRQVASMAGKLPEEVLQAITRNAGGNPFLVSAMLHGLVEVGALVNDSASWRVDQSALAELQSSQRAADFLAVRLTKLEEAPRELFTVGALLGRTFDPVIAGALAGVDPREAMRLAEMSRGSLVWAESAGGSFTFIHDKIRDALLARLSPEERRRLHLLAAEYIEREDRSRAFDLAYHFNEAGEPRRALEHALTAAEQARARFAWELAERYYRIADRATVDGERSTRFRIAKALGEILTLRARYDDARERFEQALTLAGERRESAEVQDRWGSLEMKRGNMRAACEHCEAALRLMGRGVPRSKLGCVLWSLWELVVQLLHAYLPRLFVGRRSLEGADDDLFVIRVFHGLNGPYFFSKGVEWAGWAHLRLINLAERYPPCRELGRAYAAHAVCLNGFPSLFPRGLRISKAGAELCEKMGDPWGQAQGLTFHAMMLHYVGRYAESVAVGKRASELFDRTGDRWEANSGLDFAVDSLCRMGDLREAVRLARRIWQRGNEIGDTHALAWSLDAWSRATDGRGVPEELLAAERARKDQSVQTSLALDQAEGVRLLGMGRPAEASVLLEDARQRNLKEAGFFYDLNTPLLVYRIAALRAQAEAASSWAPGERDLLLEEARRAVKRAMPVARKFRNNLSHALRESAWVSAMIGHSVRARAEIDESVAVADGLGQRYERALSRQARGQLGKALGWEGAALEHDEAEEALRAIRGAVASEMPQERPTSETQTLSLVDRFATLLSAGRALATALTAEAVYAELKKASVTLLRAEHCVVLQVKLEERNDSSAGEPALAIVPVHGDYGLSVSMDLVREATRSWHAAVQSGAELLDAELRRAAIRSAICVPIVVRGNVWGCLYVCHGEVDELFGEPEIRIGEFLGTLGGAALENAEGFSQIRSFSRILESRVEERTAELERNLFHLHETQDQLVQAGKMAAIGTLVAGLSHELNNPLGVILGYVHSLLQRVPPDAPTHPPLVAIERQTRRCVTLVRTLLDFSRTKPLARERVQASTLCDNVLQLIAGVAKTERVHLEARIETGNLPELVVCAQEIESALLNLLSNAIDVSVPGGIVELDVRPADEAAVAGVEFAVRDAGPGIPAGIVAQIFDPFFTTKPVGRGTGLGLSLARRVVQAHGGHIDVETAEGKGTRMRIWLPVAQDRQSDESFSDDSVEELERKRKMH